jgi:hypothetical protein
MLLMSLSFYSGSYLLKTLWNIELQEEVKYKVTWKPEKEDILVGSEKGTEEN